MLLVVAFAIGCGGLFPPSEPTFEVHNPGGHRDFTLRVVDLSGLVTAARDADTFPPATADAQATIGPGNNDLTIRWIGGACHFAPTVTVSGTTESLHLLLEPDAGPGLPFFASCPAVGILFGVTITLTMPVEQDAITLEVR